MPARVRLLLALLCCALLAGSGHANRILLQDAYIWQRHWTPSLASALRQSADLMRAWRILAVEIDAQGNLHRIDADRAAVAHSNRPAILVLRIDGRLAAFDTGMIHGVLAAALLDWHAAGVSIGGIEIDHDCATAALGDYARRLAQLRARLDPALRLSITALPAWSSSPDLPAVLASVDEAVLQVHAVRNPRAGLFDAAMARTWIDDFARHSRTPFRVSLPTYGARVAWDADGQLLGVESERPLLVGGATTTELIAPPRAVAALLQDLQRDPPESLAGVVWFRLPTEDDRRAWSVQTWRAVVQGTTLRDSLTVRVMPGDKPGLQLLALVNPGPLDATLPQAIALPQNCTVADGVDGYALEYTATVLSLRRQQAGLLHGDTGRMIGWMRCAASAEDLRVTP
jgi:Protein of unknown function (DUF3142)